MSGFNIAEIERERGLQFAERVLAEPTLHVTDIRCERSEGGSNDFYSEGDYWWPDPDTPDGRPYISRDGESNPDAFNGHRRILRTTRTAVATLAAAHRLTGEQRYADAAGRRLREFFLDPDTRMNPHLRYAQAIPGRCSGRAIGGIDMLHAVEIPVAVSHLEAALPDDVMRGLVHWFSEFLNWMTTHPHGVRESEQPNNHSVAWAVQASAFARFVGRADVLDRCRALFKERFIPEQMADDGSFPEELARTKPYGYSLFQLDLMALLAQVLSTPDDDLWSFALPDGRGMRRAMSFLFPYIADKKRWPHRADVQHFDAWPVRQPSLLFGGLAWGETRYLDLWRRLDPDPDNDEVRRNLALRQPLLWV